MKADMLQYQELLKHLIREAAEDEVGLWYVVRCVRDDLHVTESSEARRISMSLVRDLLGSGEVQAASHNYPHSLYKPWSLTDNEVIARINEEWDKLGRDPNIAEVVVFVGKEKNGDVLAQQAAAADSAGSR